MNSFEPHPSDPGASARGEQSSAQERLRRRFSNLTSSQKTWLDQRLSPSTLSPAATVTELVACVVADPALTTEDLREFLRQSLPDYMLPARTVAFEKLPLMPNGKVDRQELAACAGSGFAASAPPSSSLAGDSLSRSQPPPEQQGSAPESNASSSHSLQSEDRRDVHESAESVLTRLWCELLHVAQPKLDDNFFSLGGHSLLAIQLISRIRQACQVELALREVFEHPTIRELALLVRAAAGQPERPVPIPLRRIPRSSHVRNQHASQPPR
jgi:aryl carrier-like protein